MPKNDRIRRLVPVFYGKRFRLPYELHYIDYEGKTQDFVKQFINDELQPFPVAVHDDMLDCVSRIEDPMFPTEYPQSVLPVDPTAAANNNYDPLAYR